MTSKLAEASYPPPRIDSPCSPPCRLWLHPALRLRTDEGVGEASLRSPHRMTPSTLLCPPFRAGRKPTFFFFFHAPHRPPVLGPPLAAKSVGICSPRGRPLASPRDSPLFFRGRMLLPSFRSWPPPSRQNDTM